MKKHLFLLAMVASILVACKKEVNPPAIPEHDYSVATKVSKNVRSILGESKADVEKAVLDAGFQIVDQDIFNAPQRVIRLERVPVEDDEEILCFAFNLTPDRVDMTETEIVNIIIDYNYMFLMRGDGTPYDIFFNLVGGNPILYPLTVMFLFILYMGAVYGVAYAIPSFKKQAFAKDAVAEAN